MAPLGQPVDRAFVTSEKLRDFVQRHHSLGAYILSIRRDLFVHFEFSFPSNSLGAIKRLGSAHEKLAVCPCLPAALRFNQRQSRGRPLPFPITGQPYQK